MDNSQWLQLIQWRQKEFGHLRAIITLRHPVMEDVGYTLASPPFKKHMVL